MDKYIALQPLRFDRDYAIGESIPEGVIDPRSVKRLTQFGKIAVLPEDNALCPECGKKCGSKAALISHMKTHTAE